MNIIAIIPARLASNRLSKKVLADICGKTMIERVYLQVKKVPEINRVIVATDAQEIVDEVKRFGGEALLTSKEHKTGTDRIVEVAKQITCDIVINVQGDEPLIEPSTISSCLAPLLDKQDLHMTTLVAPIDSERALDPDIMKIVFDTQQHILYMSRSKIPSLRGAGQNYMHIGMYCYRRDFLLEFAQLEQTPLEIAESAEIMRLVENGHKIKTVEIQHEPRSVDNMEDLEEVRKIISSMQLT